MTVEDEQARFLRCIGEPTRLRIIKLLASGEKSVSEVMNSLNKEQSLISHHLGALKECNIVIARQEAKNVYYKIADTRLAELVLTSESIMKELPLCQIKATDYEKQNNHHSCGKP